MSTLLGFHYQDGRRLLQSHDLRGLRRRVLLALHERNLRPTLPQVLLPHDANLITVQPPRSTRSSSVVTLTRCMYAVALCLSVCVLSQVSVLLKRLNIGLRKRNHTIAQVLCQMQVGSVKIDDFQKIMGYISKTVHIVSVKVE